MDTLRGQAIEMLPWLCHTRKMSPWSEGTAKERGQDVPLLEDKEDMAYTISWTEEMQSLMLEAATDKLRGPQGEGEGDIE